MFPQLIGSLEELAWQGQEVSCKGLKGVVCPGAIHRDRKELARDQGMKADSHWRAELEE